MQPAMTPLLSVAVLIAGATWSLGGGLEHAAIATLGAGALLLAVGCRAARGALPLEPLATPVDVVLGAAAVERRHELEALGFELLGEPFTVNQATPGVVMPFVHRRRGVLAAVYEFPGGRTSTDLVTMFADGGMLTTAGVREAGCLPVPEAAWLQIAAGANAAELSALHEQGVVFARSRGREPMAATAVDEAQFEALLLGTLRRQRERFDRAPLRSSAVLMWRVLSGRSPHLRPLREQHGDGGGQLATVPQ